MRKFLSVIVAGLAAASFSALAADDKAATDTEKSTGSRANSAGNTGVGASADVKTDKKAKEKHSAGAGGTKADAKADVKPRPPRPRRQRRSRRRRRRKPSKASFCPRRAGRTPALFFAY